MRGFADLEQKIKMGKSGIKSFIFSFILTLSAVLLVDKLLPSAPKEITPTKKISYKNIALFSEKKDDLVVASASISPSKIKNFIKEENIEKQKRPENKELAVIYEESLPSSEETIVADNSDVVYNPEKIISFEEPVEYSFEELMAMNHITVEDQSSATENIQQNNPEEKIANENISTEKIQLADNSFDENINLWLPIEKGETKLDIADSSKFSQVAMSDNSVMLSSVIEKEKAKVETLDDAILVAKAAGNKEEIQNNQKESPWITAKGAKYTKNRRASVLFKKQGDENVKEIPQKTFSLNKVTDGSEARAVSGILNKYPKKPDGSIDVAYKVMDNLLIPIPEEILQDDNLTPQLVASDDDNSGDSDIEKNKKKLKKKTKKEKKSQSAESRKKKSSLFESIGSFFNSSKNKKKEKNKDLKEYDVYDDEDEDYDESVVADEDSEEDISVAIEEKGYDTDFSSEFSGILPTEIKLSFQPEKAEISGPTLRWLRAFAENAKKSADTYIEVRIDGSGAFALQQRRLNLLQGIFFENGVQPEKINTIFTSREPNSFVIRNIRIIGSEQKEEKTKKETKTYYQTW